MYKSRRFISVLLVIFTVILLVGVNVSLARASSIKVEKKVFTEKGDQYSIKIEYPHVIDYDNKKSQEKFNTEIKKSMKKAIESFKGFYKKAKKETPKLRLPWNLDMKYEIKYQKHELISVSMFGSEFTGGAHGNPLYSTISYDFKKGENIELKDLFKPKSKYLEKISKYCIDDLSKRKHADKKWIRDGAKPEAKNYQCFALQDDGLLIFFPAYQVACYAAGVQKVMIPYKELKDIIEMRGPIGGIMKK